MHTSRDVSYGVLCCPMLRSSLDSGRRIPYLPISGDTYSMEHCAPCKGAEVLLTTAAERLVSVRREAARLSRLSHWHVVHAATTRKTAWTSGDHRLVQRLLQEQQMGTSSRFALGRLVPSGWPTSHPGRCVAYLLGSGIEITQALSTLMPLASLQPPVCGTSTTR